MSTRLLSLPVYKDKGSLTDLKNYRPISLINVDMKSLTKTLANRLKQVLSSLIHQSQTAVRNRTIDHTIHLVRDIIQLAINEDLEAVFLFLDQEKVFDRVNHSFFIQNYEGLWFWGKLYTVD